MAAKFSSSSAKFWLTPEMDWEVKGRIHKGQCSSIMLARETITRKVLAVKVYYWPNQEEYREERQRQVLWEYALLDGIRGGVSTSASNCDEPC
jgi:hypothetical protein